MLYPAPDGHFLGAFQGRKDELEVRRALHATSSSTDDFEGAPAFPLKFCKIRQNSAGRDTRVSFEALCVLEVHTMTDG
jgi:hypothetical protein